MALFLLKLNHRGCKPPNAIAPVVTDDFFSAVAIFPLGIGDRSI